MTNWPCSAALWSSYCWAELRRLSTDRNMQQWWVESSHSSQHTATQHNSTQYRWCGL